MLVHDVLESPSCGDREEYPEYSQVWHQENVDQKIAGNKLVIIFKIKFYLWLKPHIGIKTGHVVFILRGKGK